MEFLIVSLLIALAIAGAFSSKSSRRGRVGGDGGAWYVSGGDGGCDAGDAGCDGGGGDGGGGGD